MGEKKLTCHFLSDRFYNRNRIFSDYRNTEKFRTREIKIPIELKLFFGLKTFY